MRPILPPRDAGLPLVALAVWLAAWLAAAGFAGTAPEAAAQKFTPNYDESRVPEYELPMLGAVHGQEKWTQTRRPELMRLLTDHQFGRVPGDNGEPVAAKVVDLESEVALGGRAVRHQYTLELSRRGVTVPIAVLAYFPKDSGKAEKGVPAFLTLNFRGNHTTTADPNVRLPKSWVPNDPKTGAANNAASEKGRGARAHRWPIADIVAAGCGIVTVYYGDIDPDFDDGFKNGVHGLFPDHERTETSWGSIAAWAWGASRVFDSFGDARLPVDEDRVVVFGHSRLGKTALWASATDPRFAGAISNNSGCGGAALLRREYGETLGRITTSFPHWFCDRFDSYADRVDELPVDAHTLLAMTAPRGLVVASAVGDRWADPKGEFLAVRAAAPAWKAFGVPSELPAAAPTPGDEPSVAVGERLRYHIRPGRHDVTGEDWRRYLDFMKSLE